MTNRNAFSVADLRNRIGEEVLVSDWLEIDQRSIDAFAEVTGDRQWVHIDPQRAALESPYGSTIAHGFLVLALIPRLGEALFAADGLRLSLNYGLDRVRFISPVRVGSRLRARYALSREVAVKDAVQIVWIVTVEIEGEAKPACVAEFITRWYLTNDPGAGQ